MTTITQPYAKRTAHTNRAYQRFVWGFLIYTILVILWGGVVRATGSGAGCGSHWPTCNGDVVPLAPTLETFIEYFHRITSGLMGPLALLLVGWGWRRYGWRHRVTKAGLVTTFFILVEGAVGAGLVLFELVAYNTSSIRAFVMGVHLVNTLLLVGALGLTAYWASGGKPIVWRARRGLALGIVLALLGVMIVGAFGAITALGDLLFPAESFLAGAAAKFNPNAHFSVHARLWHPALAVGISGGIFFFVVLNGRFWQAAPARLLARVSILLIFIQLAAGGLNVLLAVPLWMQIVHLLLATLLWLALLLLGARALAPEAAKTV